MVELGLHYMYILGKGCVCIYTYANMYMHMTTRTVHQNPVCACMYAFLGDVWLSSLLQ